MNLYAARRWLHSPPRYRKFGQVQVPTVGAEESSEAKLSEMAYADGGGMLGVRGARLEAQWKR